LAQEIRPIEVKELREIFMTLDIVNEGVIYFSDLKAALRCTRRAVEALRWEGDLLIDFDSLEAELAAVWGERISYTEFMAAILGPKASIHRKAAHGAFDRLDVDCSGEITLMDLGKVFNGSLDHKDISDWLYEVASLGEDAMHVTFDAFFNTLDRSWFPAESHACRV